MAQSCMAQYLIEACQLVSMLFYLSSCLSCYTVAWLPGTDAAAAAVASAASAVCTYYVIFWGALEAPLHNYEEKYTAEVAASKPVLAIH